MSHLVQAWSIAVLSVLGFSCTGPERAYVGPVLPSEEIARVTGRADLGIVDALAVAAGTTTRPEIPESLPESLLIRFVDGVPVKGDALGIPAVDLLPGAHELVVQGKRFLTGPDRIEASDGRLQFHALGGERYRLAAAPSEHQAPWSYRLIREADGEVIASSEPLPGKLDLSALPGDAQEWSMVSWEQYAMYSQALNVPPGEAIETAPQYLIRSRSRLHKNVTPGGARYQSVRAKRLERLAVEEVDVGPGAWLERWHDQPNQGLPEGVARRGVSLHEIVDGVHSTTAFISREPSAADVDEILRVWETRLLRAAGFPAE